MAKITIGNTEYHISELNFSGLERAWPFIEKAMVATSNNPMEGPLAALRVIAAGLMEEEDFQSENFGITVPSHPDRVHEQVTLFLKKKLKASQMASLGPCMETILQEAGLGPPREEDQSKGEDEGTVMATLNPSLETAPPSSPNSSPPDAKEEVGSE